MKRITMKNQLKILSLMPVLLIAIVFSLLYHQQHQHGIKQHMVENGLLLIRTYERHVIILFILLASLVFGFFLYSILLRNIYQPIARLKRSMQAILRNEFSTPITNESTGEFGIIEQGCLHLQTHYFHALQDLNQSIETLTTDLQHSLELLEEKNIELSMDKKKIQEKSRQKSAFIANMSH